MDTEKVAASLGRIEATLDAQNKILASHTKALAGISYTLDGNGKPGLKTLVDRHETKLASYTKVFWLVVSPILAAVGGGALTGVIYLIRQFK